MAFVSQFRFAAAESVDQKNVSKAISFVLVGGIFAAYLGPEIGKRGLDLIQSAPYVEIIPRCRWIVPDRIIYHV